MVTFWRSSKKFSRLPMKWCGKWIMEEVEAYREVGSRGKIRAQPEVEAALRR
jgi:hypothetical protein